MKRKNDPGILTVNDNIMRTLQKHLKKPIKEICSKCGGKGKFQTPVARLQCQACGGKGFRQHRKVFRSTKERCDTCNGSGQVEHFKEVSCHICSGTGQVEYVED